MVAEVLSGIFGCVGSSYLFRLLAVVSTCLGAQSNVYALLDFYMFAGNCTLRSGL